MCPAPPTADVLASAAPASEDPLTVDPLTVEPGPPFRLRLEATGVEVPVGPPSASGVLTVGRGPGTSVRLDEPSVSRLHAELVLRGPHVYVADLGLSSNGTRVNGRPVGCRVLREDDVLSFGACRVRISGLALGAGSADDTGRLARPGTPEVTRRELHVLTALCRPALRQDAFVAPATAREVAEELVVTEAAVKQHLLRLYAKFGIEEGLDRRARLANTIIAQGLVRPVPQPEPDHRRAG